MDLVLGLFAVVAWVAGVIALAAAITYAVVRVTPGGERGES